MARSQAMQKVTGGGLAPWQAELALRLLLRDLCAEVPVAQVAILCGLSRSYFTRAFKVSMGMPPHRWLVRQRVRRAAEMLERTNERISLIALSCGFSDQSHLTRMFRAIVGSSPAAWRRQRKARSAPVANLQNLLPRTELCLGAGQ
jgi:AraC-like DNA-binding protein